MHNGKQQAALSATSLIGFFIVRIHFKCFFFVHIYTRFFNINNGGILFNGNRLKYILQPLYIHISDKSRARVVNIFRLYIFLRAQPIFLGFGFGWAAQLQRIASAMAEQSTMFVRSIYMELNSASGRTEVVYFIIIIIRVYASGCGTRAYLEIIFKKYVTTLFYMHTLAFNNSL